jgi:integrase
MARLKPLIVPEQPIPFIPADGLRRLLTACAGNGFQARRDTAIIMLLLDTGARRTELADLQLTHVDLDLDVLLVLGRGRREHALPANRAQGRRGPGARPPRPSQARRPSLAVDQPPVSRRASVSKLPSTARWISHNAGQLGTGLVVMSVSF